MTLIINPNKVRHKRNMKLKNFLCLVKNKRNLQYSFILKKRALDNAGLSPKKILNISIFAKE